LASVGGSRAATARTYVTVRAIVVRCARAGAVRSAASLARRVDADRGAGAIRFRRALNRAARVCAGRAACAGLAGRSVRTIARLLTALFATRRRADLAARTLRCARARRICRRGDRAAAVAVARVATRVVAVVTILRIGAAAPHDDPERARREPDRRFTQHPESFGVPAARHAHPPASPVSTGRAIFPEESLAHGTSAISAISSG